MKRIVKVISSILLILFISLSLFSCNKDSTPPVITILGDNPVNTCVDMGYMDAGATALDDEDGDISSSIKINSNVDTLVDGSYHVTYTVSDNAGNEATAQREVNVIFCK